MKVTFKIQEVLYTFIQVEAENTDKAREIVEKMNEDGGFDIEEIEDVNILLWRVEAEA